MYGTREISQGATLHIFIRRRSTQGLRFDIHLNNAQRRRIYDLRVFFLLNNYYLTIREENVSFTSFKIVFYCFYLLFHVFVC